MRVYFLRNGHIRAVEPLTDVSDEAAVEEARELFESARASSKPSRSGIGRGSFIGIR